MDNLTKREFQIIIVVYIILFIIMLIQLSKTSQIKGEYLAKIDDLDNTKLYYLKAIKAEKKRVNRFFETMAINDENKFFLETKEKPLG